MNLRRTLGLLALLLWAGCNTPSVPLPPPSPDDFDVMVSSQSQFVLSGDPQQTRPAARYEIYNVTLGRGVIVKAGADGAFVSPPMEGRAADEIEISYQLGPEESDYISGVLCVILPAASRALSEADRCP